MARVTFVTKARKDQGTCRRNGCGKTILTGDSYYWFANLIGRSSQRKNFCAEHRPKPSEMTTSDKLSRLYGAQEELETALSKATTYEDIASALRDAANEAREVGEEYQESLSNMPEGLQQGQTGQDIEEKAQNCESWADELESAADEIESKDDDDIDDDAECQNCSHPYSEHEDGKACKHEKDEDSDEEDCTCTEFEADDSGLEEARSQADDAAGNLSI
jgi:hypothetical protein